MSNRPHSRRRHDSFGEATVRELQLGVAGSIVLLNDPIDESVRRVWDNTVDNVNFAGEGGDETIAASYPTAVFRRLGGVKDRYDPSTFFFEIQYSANQMTGRTYAASHI